MSKTELIFWKFNIIMFINLKNILKLLSHTIIYSAYFGPAQGYNCGASRENWAEPQNKALWYLSSLNLSCTEPEEQRNCLFNDVPNYYPQGKVTTKCQCISLLQHVQELFLKLQLIPEMSKILM